MGFNTTLVNNEIRQAGFSSIFFDIKSIPLKEVHPKHPHLNALLQEVKI